MDPVMRVLQSIADVEMAPRARSVRAGFGLPDRKVRADDDLYQSSQ